jgi:tetratricopeptide (TPR) repeat protein
MNTPGFLDLLQAERPDMARTKTLLLALIVFAFYITGCAKHQAGLSNVSTDNANELNAQHAKFERADDPPFTAQTHFAAGQLAESQEAIPSAIAHYEAALKIDTHHHDSLFRLGILYTKQKSFAHAIGAWKQYIKESKGDPTAYANLGFCYELAGRSDDAEKAYQDGIARDANNPACRVNYGLFLARVNRPDEAAAQFKAVLPEAQVHYNLGSIFEQQGNRERAKTEFRRALQIDANLTDAKTRLAALD